MLNSILNEDCFKTFEKLEDNSIDLILTDPPYGINYKLNISKNKNKIFSEIKNDSPVDIDWSGFFEEAYRVLKDKKMIYLFGRTDFFLRISKFIEESKFNYCHDFLWLKGDMASGNINIFGQTHEIIIGLSKGKPEKSRIVTIDNLPKKRSKASYYKKLSKKEYYGHPTQKPVGLLSYIISNRTDVDDIVYDPFSGSSSTLISAKILNRKFLGSEIDSQYFSLSQKRLLDKEHISLYEEALENGFVSYNGSITLPL